ncbi:hypothetical protein GCM10020229_54730 [Kitasatospora albolonga]
MGGLRPGQGAHRPPLGQQFLEDRGADAPGGAGEQDRPRAGGRGPRSGGPSREGAALLLALGEQGAERERGAPFEDVQGR